jgi:hypothetical protein
MTEIVDDSSCITGQIYLITNSLDDKKYVGQSLSHRKNKNKYKPFGFEGRFKDHISEAICNTKKKQCNYLNNAIRAYGKDKFTVVLVKTCLPSEMDLWEQYYIREYNTLYPNGYNLTVGGKVFKHSIDYQNKITNLNEPKKRGGCIERTDDTRKKMSSSLRKTFGNETVRKELMSRTQKQHADQKFQKFSDVTIDTSDINKYLRIINSTKLGQYVRVVINNKRVSFVGKYETIETLKTRAIEFLLKVNYAATLSNCSGNP